MAIQKIEVKDEWPEIRLQKVLILGRAENRKANANVGFVLKTLTGYVRAWVRPDTPVRVDGKLLTAKEFAETVDGSCYYRALADVEYGEKEGILFVNLFVIVSKHDFE